MDLKELREAAKAIVYSAIQAVNPEALVRKSVRRETNGLIIGKSNINLDEFRRILIVGAGKASASMAKALEDILGDRISDGLIAVKASPPQSLKRISVLETGHPIPDERGVETARRMLSLVQENARADTLVLCVISGGGSALLPLPRESIPLADKQETTRLLLECGASVDEINTVRKHISRIKGGQLARAAAPARVFSLILSDVIGDPLDVIASGPTVGDSSTFSDVRAIMEKYKIWHLLPESVRNVIEKGLRGEIEETPKPDDNIFERVTNLIIGNNRSAIEAASVKASALGFHPLILTTCISGEAREVGIVLASIAIEAEVSHNPVVSPACILAGGETTVTIRGEGKGGRNQELALSAALKLGEAKSVVIASVGTDGTDGPTDAAGAIVDTTTVARAHQAGLDPMEYLNRNDSYNLLEPIGDLLITGPTGTNVMDLLIALIGSQ
jgi:glycerate 2-kinase